MMIARNAFGADDKGILENELLHKVYECIEKYDPSYDATFDTFVNKCLTNHIQVHLRSQKRKKHAFITDAISINYCVEDGDCISDLIADPETIRPDAMLFVAQLNEILDVLPDVCKDIAKLICEGMLTESEIGKMIGEDTELVKAFISECIRPLIEEVMLIGEDQNV